MNEQENVQVVQKLFAAFGQANIPSALDILAVAGKAIPTQRNFMG